ncbi:Pimeloyl-ACP methyl ester carboxylesterase [Rhizobium hainanense]|uniref:Pimeloyl-ACP methyl ester carboxylesterase n=3 Tax=cellular organisms TaxID=131567 RepID=A0A1C3VIY4_9HYPH|nr:alpha/beta hydrolase [Rhizobium hainanense]SCB27743.1 Pimeloyl-ACP methyl ester carboxylesterase [Rhizobium hainanense]
MPAMETMDQNKPDHLKTEGLLRKHTVRGTAYHEVGKGEPLVLIHGVGMRLEAWTPQIEAFSGSHRVIAVDMPGHGESVALPAGSPLQAFVAWFGGFLDEMELGKVNVAGHSMGALVAGGAAATFGERIERIAYLNGVYRRDPEAKAAVLARAASIPLAGVDKEGPLLRWFGDDAQSAVARELTRNWLSLVDPQGYATAYAAFAGGDETYADRWPGIGAPALFLTGSDDPNSTPLMAEQMASAAPRGWVRIVEGHRHMVNLTAPDIVNELLAEWLSCGEDAR